MGRRADPALVHGVWLVVWLVWLSFDAIGAGAGGGGGGGRMKWVGKWVGVCGCVGGSPAPGVHLNHTRGCLHESWGLGR